MSERIRARIHFTDAFGGDDWFDIEGDEIEELQVLAQEGVEKRAGTDPWSEELP